MLEYKGIFKTLSYRFWSFKLWSFSFWPIAGLWLISLLSGCAGNTRLAFVPSSTWFSTPETYGLEWESIDHLSLDRKTLLNSWWLPAQSISQSKSEPQASISDSQVAKTGLQPSKTQVLTTPPKALASILFLHGNAENISTHINSVKWLPREGYQVFLLGYRGFGASQGEPKLPDILYDVASAARWIQINHPDVPLIVLGQSMGAALAINFSAKYQHQFPIQGLVLDACFEGFPKMAMQSLSRVPLTWPLIPIAWSLFPSTFDPVELIGQVQPVPKLFFHSRQDPIVPYSQGRNLYQIAPEPKAWFDAKGTHIQTFKDEQARQRLLEFLQTTVAGAKAQTPAKPQTPARLSTKTNL